MPAAPDFTVDRSVIDHFGFDPASDVFVSAKAISKLAEHYPSVGVRGTLNILAKSRELEAQDVLDTLDCDPQAGTRYFLPREARGLLALAPSDGSLRSPWVIVVYVAIDVDERKELFALEDARKK